MPFNGSGTFSLVAGNPVVTGATISSTWANSTLSDLSTGLTTAICKDGQTTPTANLPMGTFKHTGAGSATASGQYLVYGQSNASLGSTTFTGTTAMSGAAFNFASEVDVASATTTDIGGAASNSIRITGTTTITSFGTTYTGARFIRFAGALTLTHNASSLILPGGASITTAAGDTCIAMPLPSSAGWYVQNYTKASGQAVVSSTAGAQFLPITASVGSSALTVSLASGTVITFNDGTSVTLGSTITATASSGSTLGTTSAVPSTIWVAVLKNSGTPELAIRNNVAVTNGQATHYPFGADGVISTTAEGGAGAADSAGVWYSTTSRSSQPFAIAGFVVSTQATAGTWASAPTLTQPFGPGVALPGAVLQQAVDSVVSSGSGTTPIPDDDTIPQNTEGDQVNSLTFTKKTAANLLRLSHNIQLSTTTTGVNQVCATFKSGSADAIHTASTVGAGGAIGGVYDMWYSAGDAAGSLTYTTRVGDYTASTRRWNGSAGGRKYGGTMTSWLKIEEIQA